MRNVGHENKISDQPRQVRYFGPSPSIFGDDGKEVIKHDLLAVVPKLCVGSAMF